MDHSPPGSSVHGISQARILEWGCHFSLQGIFPAQGLNLHWQAVSLPLSHQGSPGHIYTYSCFTSLYSGNQHNIGSNYPPIKKIIGSNYPPIKNNNWKQLSSNNKKGGGLNPLYLILRLKPPLPFLQILIRQESFAAQHKIIIMGSLSWFSHCWF